MRAVSFALAFAALLGAAAAQAAAPASFPTVLDAVKSRADLSLLAANVDNIGDLGTQFSDPDYVATLFAPTNAALQYLAKLVDNTTDYCNPNLTKIVDTYGADTLIQVFNGHIIPNKALNSSSFKDGAEFMTAANNTVTVKKGTVTEITNGGSVPELSTGKIGAANIFGGKAVIHTIDHVLIPTELQGVLAPSSDEPGAPPPSMPAPVTTKECPLPVAGANITRPSINGSTPITGAPTTGAPAASPATPPKNGAAAVAAGVLAAVAAPLAALLL